MSRLLVALFVCLAVVGDEGAARSMGKCEVTRELIRLGVSRSLLSNWICLVEHVSGGNTSAEEGPFQDQSYNLGIFQINSKKWCRDDYVGGNCHLRCEALVDDSIADDIRCAVRVHNHHGFAGWPEWMAKCKGKSLPNISECLKQLTFHP